MEKWLEKGNITDGKGGRGTEKRMNRSRAFFSSNLGQCLWPRTHTTRESNAK